MSGDEDDAQRALEVLEGTDPAPASEAPAFVTRLRSIRTLIGAFDALGVASDRVLAAPPCETWGPFVLKEEIGRGGSGLVCRAFDPAVERDVAVKLYTARELPAEPRLMARVRHPNVLTVLGAAVHDGRPGIWMELVSGRTLAARVQQDGPATPDEVVRIGLALCGALAAVHAAGLVHQDVKPHNVMEEANGRIVLMDFGASVSRQGDAGDPDRLSGTPLYMAPEVVMGEAPSPRSDVYSLGVVLYYLLTGTYPVFASDFDELRQLHERQHHRTGTTRFAAALRELRPEASPALAACVARALAPAGRRHASPSALEADLANAGRAPRARPRRWALWATGLTAAALGAGLTYWMTRRDPPAPTPFLESLTSDHGLTTDPAVSSDGKLLAYASDRAEGGSLDIWVRQLAGNDPLQLTFDAADDHAPTFSPDGTTVVFRSERDGGGVYAVPSFGGATRLILPQAHSPRYSPDGRRLACILGAGRSGVTATGSVAVVSASGGTPQPLGLSDVSLPIWSPDGRHILVMGHADTTDEDWWVVAADPLSGAAPIRTGARDLCVRAGFATRDAEAGTAIFPRAYQWIGTRLLFAATRGEAEDLWEVDIAPRTFRLSGPPRRLTTGTEAEPSATWTPGGTLVFAARSATNDIWQATLDPQRGTVRTELQPITRDPSFEELPTLSADGRSLAYLSRRRGNTDVWVKDLETHKELALTASAEREANPVIARDGRSVVYASFAAPRKPTIYTVPARPGQVPEKICDICGVPTDVSHDGRWLVVQHFPDWPGGSSGVTLGVYDRASGVLAHVLQHSQYNVYRGHLSPDEQWISFKSEHLSADTRAFIAPFRGTSPIPEDDWIQITDGSSFVDAPRWSADGNVLYFALDRDGFRCVWGQRLDPATKQPKGPPFAALHVHHQRPTLNGVGSTLFDIAVSERRIVLNMIAPWANIWSARFE